MFKKIDRMLGSKNRRQSFAFFTALLFIFLCILLGVGKIRHNKMVEQRDYLVYVTNGYFGQGQLMFYDPATNIHTPILPDWGIGRISISVNDQLAFISSHGGNKEIYTLDYPFTANTPVSIARTMAEYPLLSWSPDGYYLAYTSVKDDRNELSLWNGKTISHIYYYQGQIGHVAWGPDNQLAFTEFYTFGPTTDSYPSEIFFWDGNAIISLSQNPSGEDRYPAWSADGQLAFLSAWEGEYSIFVWDGISRKDSVPDRSTFVNTAPGLAGYFSNPVWTNSDSLTFQTPSPEYRHMQIYEWDGQTANNISQNPDFHNGSQHWRNDGYWAFATYFSSQQLVYIRNEQNKPVLTMEGESPAWSQSGYLTFCVFSGYAQTLSMWNGITVIEIVQVQGSIRALWRNGQGVHCSMSR